MGAREDFMAVRRAAVHTDQDPEGGPNPYDCMQRLLARASAREADFIRLHKAGIQAEVIDLAYAVLGEEREGGPAVTPEGSGA